MRTQRCFPASLAIAGSVLVLVAACSPAPPPSAPATAVSAGPIEAPPIYALIGHRQELRLTSEQVGMLDSIGTWLQSENGPAVRRLRELRGELPRGPAPTRNGERIPQAEEVRTLVDRLRENNRAAVDQVQEVLTPEQETRVCELFRETDQQRRRREAMRAGPGGGGTAQRRRPAGMEPSIPPSVWRWCASPTAPVDTAAAPADTTS